MSNKNLILELERIKEIMLIKENRTLLTEGGVVSELVQALFNRASRMRISSEVGAAAGLQRIGTDLINAGQRAGLPSNLIYQQGDNVFDYMMRISREPSIGDDFMEAAVKIFKDRGMTIDRAATETFANSIKADNEIIDDLARVFDNDVELRTFLRKFNVGDDLISDIAPLVSKARNNLPVETLQTVKIAGLKKYLGLWPQTVQYANVSKEISDAIKQVFAGDPATAKFLEGIASGENIEKYASSLITQLKNSPSIQTAEDAIKFLTDNIKEQAQKITGAISSSPEKKTMFQNAIQKLGLKWNPPTEKIVDGVKAPATAFDITKYALKYNMTLGFYLSTIFAGIEIKYWDAELQECYEKTAQETKQISYNKLSETEQKIITKKCKQERWKSFIGGEALTVLGGPIGMGVYYLLKDADIDLPVEGSAGKVDDSKLKRPDEPAGQFTNDATGFENFLKVEYKKPNGEAPKFNDADKAVMKNEGNNKWSFVPFIGGKDQPKRTWEFKNGNFVEIK